MSVLVLTHDESLRLHFIGHQFFRDLKLYRKVQDLAILGTPFTHHGVKISNRDMLHNRANALKELGDFELSRAVKLLGLYSTFGDSILSISSAHTACMRDADVIFCTVPQAKGLEWERVVLGTGSGVYWGNEIGVWTITHAAINNMYVAATRAQRILFYPDADFGNLVWEDHPLLRGVNHTQLRTRLVEIGVTKAYALADEEHVRAIKANGISTELCKPLHLQHAAASKVCLVFSTQIFPPVYHPHNVYVLEVDIWGLLDSSAPAFYNGNERVRTYDQLRRVFKLYLLVSHVPAHLIVQCYPLRAGPQGVWASNRGDLKPAQWFTSFGDTRAERAKLLHRAGGIWQMDNGKWFVPSQSGVTDGYEVLFKQKPCQTGTPF